MGTNIVAKPWPVAGGWYTPDQVHILSAVFATQDMARARYEGGVLQPPPRYMQYQGTPFDHPAAFDWNCPHA